VDAVRADLKPTVRVDLVGRADLVTLAAVLQAADLLVTGDTGPMHLASALDVPVVAVFGPSDPARWGPASARARVVRVSLPCSLNQFGVARAMSLACAGLPRGRERGCGYDAAVGLLRPLRPTATPVAWSRWRTNQTRS
jgi:hypothetical protein